LPSFLPPACAHAAHMRDALTGVEAERVDDGGRRGCSAAQARGGRPWLPRCFYLRLSLRVTLCCVLLTLPCCMQDAAGGPLQSADGQWFLKPLPNDARAAREASFYDVRSHAFHAGAFSSGFVVPSQETLTGWRLPTSGASLIGCASSVPGRQRCTPAGAVGAHLWRPHHSRPARDTVPASE